MIFGITGKKGSGKDTLGRSIIAALAREGITGKKVFFAEPLKKATCAILGYSMAELEDEVFKATVDPFINRTPRYVLQVMGTEFGRELIKDSLWVDIASRNISQILGEGGVAVVTDVRFENEADMIRERDGLIIHIINDELNDSSETSHASEAGITLRDDDLVVLNYPSRGVESLREISEHLASTAAFKYAERKTGHELRSFATGH